MKFGERNNAARSGGVLGLAWAGAVGRGALVLVWLGSGLAWGAVSTEATSWPMHRADSGRTAYREGGLAWPLHRAWSYSGGVPRPAWGPPARRSYWQRLESIAPRVADDHCHAVVMGDGAVYFGSTADDGVRCLDGESGEERWVFWAEGPVRYAPVLAHGRIHFGSDDGWVYALAAADGRLLWRHRPGPEDWRIPGNGRVISSWPIRTGLLVEEGVVHATAGLYPQQGVWACALDAASGAVRWQAPLSVSAEGYLLSTERSLLVPTGRASPMAVDRETGREGRTFDTGGGTFAVVHRGEVFGGPGNSGQVSVQPGPAANVGGKGGPSSRLVSADAHGLVARNEEVFLLQGREMTAVHRGRLAALERAERSELARLEQLERRRRAGGTGAPSEAEIQGVRERLVEIRKDQTRCELWRVPCSDGSSLIGLGDVLVAGGSNRVAIHRMSDGVRVWESTVEGRVLSLAAADGRLVVSTDRGTIEAFTARPGGGSAGRAASSIMRVRSSLTPTAAPASGEASLPSSSEPAAVGEVRRWLGGGPVSRGFAVVAGVGSGSIVRELLATTELEVVVTDPDPARVERLRRAIDRREGLGSRLSLHVVAGGRLPYTDEFANLVISESALEGEPLRVPFAAEEFERLVRPFGGWRWTDPAAGPIQRGALAEAGAWTHQFGNPANTANSGEGRVGSDLRLQWFGGPGPDLMVDRHLRGPAPLAAAGRLLVPGENVLLGVDAFNGTEWWRCELPGSQRYSMPYDAGYLSLDRDEVAVAVQGECWVLDAGEGRVKRRIAVPTPTPTPTLGSDGGVESNAWHWGWVVLRDGALFGSAQRSTASRTRASYEQIDVDYSNEQPLVVGRSVFRVEATNGAVVWQRGSGLVLNPTLTLASGSVLFVESRAVEVPGGALGRVKLGVLMAGEPWLVSLNARTGERNWEQPLDGALAGARNVLYLAAEGSALFLVGSRVTAGNDTLYVVERRSLADGRREWVAEHPAGMPGAFAHGEQVHHPVVLADLLVAEPVVYDALTGRRHSVPWGAGTEDWRLVRPGHSCGTLSGAGDCLFFRANNPTVLDVRASLRGTDAGPRKLAPSRTGCWINMIPASGLLLVPEASAGCVCQYSLQTSMAFRRVR